MEAIQVQDKNAQKSRAGNVVHFHVDQNMIDGLKRHKAELKENFPKVGIFIISYNASNHIEKTISRIPIELYDVVEEVFIFDDASPDQTFQVAQKLHTTSAWKDKLNIYRNPVNLGYGGNQKVGYRYAINKKLDYVVMVHGDGQYAPEHLPELIYPAVVEKHQVVFGSRMMNRQDALRGGMPFYKYVGNRVLTVFENAILGTNLYEFHSGYRLYSTETLKRLPIEENTNDFHFDTQIIIQCRALGLTIHEVPIKTFYGDEVCNVNGFRYAKDVCLSVLEYRFHQLHLIRRSRYLVDYSSSYTRKRSPYSSHEQILSLIKKPGLALDLGSSTGLLTESLRSKGVESICVDMVPQEQVSVSCKQYIQANLENYEVLQFKREFDYIILADVVEHVRNAQDLLAYIQRFLKDDGRIIVSVPNIAIWIYRLSLLIGRFNYGPKGTLDETHVRFYTKFTIIQLLERSGYLLTDFKATGLPFEVVFESVGKSRFLRFLDSFYFKLAHFWPKMFAYQFVLEAKISSLRAEAGEGKL
jgi:glycosyltransferase involved in cell wall biosynthesis